MEQEREEQHRRLTEPHRSHSAKIAWKKHRNNYMRANRKKSRDYMNKTFYGVAKELEESLKYLDEAKIKKDNVFDLEGEFIFDTIAGGLSFNINKEENNISFSTLLNESGRGAYKLETTPETEDAFKQLYSDLKDDLQSLAQMIDQNMQQILAKHGLRES